MATGAELSELKEAITALDKKVDRMLSSIENLKEKQDDVAKDISKIKEAVYHPDDGIYARLKVIETWKENQTKATWIAVTAIIGLAIKQLWDILTIHQRCLLKVKISYTVDFDEVPNQVCRILSYEQLSTLNREYNDIIENISEKNTQKALTQIHDFRVKLAKIDQTLDNAQSILDGFIRAQYTDSVTEKDNESQ